MVGDTTIDLRDHVGGCIPKIIAMVDTGYVDMFDKASRFCQPLGIGTGFVAQDVQFCGYDDRWCNALQLQIGRTNQRGRARLRS